MPLGGPRLTAQDGRLNEVGARVKQRRKQLSLTQNALSGRLAHLTNSKWNPSEDEIYKLEAGKRICGDLEIKALCQALECSISWIMEEHEMADRSAMP